MKGRLFLLLPLKLIFVLMAYPAFSAHTILGLEKALYFHSTLPDSFYIQIDSYKLKSNAIGSCTLLRKKTNQLVKIKQINGYYCVLIGPMHSPALVRKTAGQILSHEKIQRQIKNKKLPTRIDTLTNLPAQTMPNKDIEETTFWNRWFLGIGAGSLIPLRTTATNFASSGMTGFPDDKYVGNDFKGAAQYAVFAGYQWQNKRQWLPAYSVSLEYSYTNSARLNGVIYVNNLPGSKNFTYKYDISQQITRVKIKANLYRWHQLMPYLGIGAGLVLNRTHNYSDSPIYGETLMQRRYGFKAASNSQFAGSLNFGLDYWLNNKGQISIGYELAYFGAVKTAYGEGTLSANRLGNKFNANVIIIQGTYFF